MIETLLPKAAYDETLQRGRLVELWAKKNAPRREGWIAFHENKFDKPVNTEEATIVPIKEEEATTAPIKEEEMMDLAN